MTMHDHDNDDRIEALLGRTRPMGPPAHLRERVLGSVKSEAVGRVGWASAAAWLSVAAALVIGLGLNWAADAVNRDTAAMVGVGGWRWTPEAEAAAALFDGDGSGRRYVALCLAAGDHFEDAGGLFSTRQSQEILQ